MNILSQFQEVLEKSFRKFLGNYQFNMRSVFAKSFSIDAYAELAQDFDNFSSDFIKNAYEVFLLELDEQFMQSNERKQSYGSKGFVVSRLITKFGIIDFKRRRYIEEENKSFMYVDRLIGLTKYSRFDAFVIADLVEEAASSSYANAGRIVSKIIGSKIKYDDDSEKNLISRATARNNVLKAASIMFEPPNYKELKEVNTLNIMVDEKFVASQEKEETDHMVKAAVVYEDTVEKSKKRIKLTGKKVFASIGGDIQTEVMDYIYYNYNTDYLKTINIMGDGAPWIKSFALDSSFKFHKDIDVYYGLDHFHVAQALQHLTTKKNKEDYDNLYGHISLGDKEMFIKDVDEFLEKNKDREETIIKKKNYILNNWKYIMNTFNNIFYKCSMEATISHVFADILTSRPKGYCLESLKGLLKIRLLKTNGYDLTKLYFESLKENTVKEINIDMEKKFIIKNKKYNDELYTPVPMIHQSNNVGRCIKGIINSGVNI